MFGWFKNFSAPSALRAAGVLGMNARNFHVIAKYNSRKLYPLVDDKVLTKTLANNIGISTPKLIGKIEFQYEVKNILDIIGDNKEFVIKPAQGSGGKGGNDVFGQRRLRTVPERGGERSQVRARRQEKDGYVHVEDG